MGKGKAIRGSLDNSVKAFSYRFLKCQSQERWKAQKLLYFCCFECLGFTD